MKMSRRRQHAMSHLLIAILFVAFVIFIGMTVTTGLNESYAQRPIDDKSAIYCSEQDDRPPEIEIRGETSATLVVGAEYDDAGIEVYDYCEILTNETIGAVDTTTPGSYEIKYRAVDSRGNEATQTRTVQVIQASRGIVYLTFDDGPGPYTAELLDILAKYNVKATFFVTGAGDDALIAREYNEGHAVGLHTTSHNYAYIYQNMDTFFGDLYAVQNRVKNITGHTLTLMRFPGGSSNVISALYDGGTRIMSQLTSEVERRGFSYFDWNVSSGDAGGASTADEVYANVVNGFREGGSSVILQHDIKAFSVAAVERIIQYGLANGWTFDKLSADSFAAHHGVNN